jgi:hypothetical protein
MIRFLFVRIGNFAHYFLPLDFLFPTLLSEDVLQTIDLCGRQLGFQFFSFLCQMQLLESAIMGGLPDRDEFHSDQLTQGYVECLFADRKDFEQDVHGDVRILADEVQYSVMDSAQTSLFQDLVRLGGKGAISEIEEFNGFTDLGLAN